MNMHCVMNLKNFMGQWNELEDLMEFSNLGSRPPLRRRADHADNSGTGPKNAVHGRLQWFDVIDKSGKAAKLGQKNMSVTTMSK